MKITYGIDIQESGDPFIKTTEEALNGINEAGVPGAFLVDMFPILKHVPCWFPGAGFQRKAAHWRAVNTTLTEQPFRYVKEQLVSIFFESSSICLSDESAGGWQSWAIHGSNPHRTSSTWRRFRTARGGKACEKFNCHDLHRSVVM